MERQELIRTMEKHTNGKGFINQGQISRFMGISPTTARAMLKNLPYYPTGREKKYTIGDVASEVLKRMQTK